MERHPELARQLEAILDTAENTDATADEIEQLLAKQLRKLSSTTMECWGSDTEEAATVLRKNVVLWDVVLYALIGLSISISVFIAGPLITFGFMLIPPLIAQVFARSMRQLGIIASIVGGAGAFAGFCAAYHWDLPIGPSNVAVLGAAYVLSLAGSAIVRFVATLTRRTRAKATERIDSPSSEAP